MSWGTFRAIFSQTHLVTLRGVKPVRALKFSKSQMLVILCRNFIRMHICMCSFDNSRACKKINAYILFQISI
jgi:hypothetical protein